MPRRAHGRIRRADYKALGKEGFERAADTAQLIAKTGRADLEEPLGGRIWRSRLEGGSGGEYTCLVCLRGERVCKRARAWAAFTRTSEKVRGAGTDHCCLFVVGEHVGTQASVDGVNRRPDLAR
eukprot:4926090-Pleurochrysis_carterae.AAC.1